MAYTVDDLRELLRDTGEPPVFSNAQLTVLADAYPDSIFRAAGAAIKTLALEAAAGERSVKTDDLAIDLRGRGKSLLDIAQSFFNDADAEDDAAGNDFFQIVPFGGRAGRSRVRPEATPRPLPVPPTPPSGGRLDGGTP